MLLLFALSVPLILLGLMVMMERVERPLRNDLVLTELEGFLQNASPGEVETYVTEGYSEALAEYWSRTGRSPRRPGPAAPS